MCLLHTVKNFFNMAYLEISMGLPVTVLYFFPKLIPRISSFVSYWFHFLKKLQFSPFVFSSGQEK